MLLLSEKTIQNGAYTYTLVTEREGDVLYFSITASDSARRVTLARFATIEAVATDFFHRIASHGVDPLHLHDVWEDYTT